MYCDRRYRGRQDSMAFVIIFVKLSITWIKYNFKDRCRFWWEIFCGQDALTKAGGG
jgi:hypothetical protein